MNRGIDYMVLSGEIDAETGEIMKSFGGNQQFWQSWKKDPTTGKWSFDAAAYAKATGAPTEDTVPAFDIETGDIWGTDANKIIAAGPSDPMYGKVVEAQAKDAIKTNSWDKLLELQKSAGTSEEFKNAFKTIPKTDAAFAHEAGIGSITILPNGALAKVTGSHRKEMKGGGHLYVKTLVTADGKKTEFVVGPSGPIQVWTTESDGTLHHTSDISQG
jgi:hypothetical protein